MKSIIIALAWATLLLCPAANAQSLKGPVERVIDGDTFDFSAIRIRICGIDAPEKNMAGGAEATQVLTRLIEGKHVRCLPVGNGSVCDGRSDTFNRGRIVAQCFVGGADIAAQMVQSGNACDWVKFSGGAYPGGCRK